VKVLTKLANLWGEVHPKLKASAGAGVVLTVLQALAKASGLPLTVTEAGTVNVVAMLLAGWLKSGPLPPSVSGDVLALVNEIRSQLLSVIARSGAAGPGSMTSTGAVSPAFGALASLTGTPAPQPQSNPAPGAVRIVPATLPAATPDTSGPFAEPGASVGHVVEGHRWTGTAWEPIPPPPAISAADDIVPGPSPTDPPPSIAPDPKPGA